MRIINQLGRELTPPEIAFLARVEAIQRFPQEVNQLSTEAIAERLMDAVVTVTVHTPLKGSVPGWN